MYSTGEKAISLGFSVLTCGKKAGFKGALSRFWLLSGGFLLLLEGTMKNITLK